MARQRKMDEAEMLRETEKLLLERGYEGFSFKALSANLDIARSTIYEYYSHKDDLITDYMYILVKKVMDEMEIIASRTTGLETMKEWLKTFMTYDQVHHMIAMRGQLDQSESEIARNRLKQMDGLHGKMFFMLSNQVNKAKELGEVRKDLPNELVASFFFHSILARPANDENIQGWADMLNDIIENGVKPRKES
ncbi:TetR/AcrR family transcriptional regulator [Paenisporosarcina quisquiliarum]|jgi:AcrR family transcriptional regulator|uniref:TetR/AcrR family transcriptional regulator n=1 Tax=Paenisporosarcina quisquiliarum TaxID=365346 RepID=A0A9X3LI33_9BACL|nr:TetR/AcrR family transcriptional regulator [Paenisporosarcina quisquiliarum]MCZ8538418.1 TetR/AcrR family transcriptional regulator [Paenisporosarcina quisquiliarum]